MKAYEIMEEMKRSSTSDMEKLKEFVMENLDWVECNSGENDRFYEGFEVAFTMVKDEIEKYMAKDIVG